MDNHSVDSDINSILNAIALPAFFKDIVGTIQNCNTAFEQFLGVTANEVISQNIIHIFGEDFNNKCIEIDIDLSSDSFKSIQVSFEFNKKQFNCIISAAKFEAVIIYYLIDIADIQLDLNQKNNSFRLFENIGSEIRMPLNSVIGFSELLLNTELDDVQKKYLGLLNNAATNLNSLLNNLMDFIQLDSDSLSFSKIFFDIKDVINLVLENLKVFDKTKNIEIGCYIDSKVKYQVEGDVFRLQQVLFNMIYNLSDFFCGNEVIINVKEMKRKQNQVVLKLSIFEEGLNAVHTKIVDLISNNDLNITKQRISIVLGISIVKKIVEKMNGRIIFDSDSKGHSISFLFPFNLCESSEEIETLYEESVVENINTDNKINVLILDDDLNNRELLKSVLLSFNCNIIDLESGKDIISTVSNNSFDLVFMDIQMPEIDGYETTILIRNYEKENNLKSMPIVALTAFVSDDKVQKCFDVGMTDYMSKPLNCKKVLNIIKKYSIK